MGIQNMKKPTTGKYSQKNYKCEGCGYEFTVGTNHWGAIYRSCPRCRNEDGSVNRCLEPCPETHDLPPEWKMVRLGDIVEISR